MEGKNRPLPIGSVVLLKGANTKMMILGYLKYGPDGYFRLCGLPVSPGLPLPGKDLCV